MDFAALKVRAAQLAAQAGLASVQPAPDWGAVVNLALEEFSWEAEYIVENATITLAAGTAIYDLPDAPPDWKRITDAVLGSGTQLDLTDEATLRRENPNWIVAPQAPPNRFWIVANNQIQFYPTPSSSGAVVTLRGIRADGPLVADTDTPACPAHYHEGIALRAAWRVCKQFAKGDDLTRVSAYRVEAGQILDRFNAFQADQEAPAFQRRVRRSIPERMALGWLRRTQ